MTIFFLKTSKSLQTKFTAMSHLAEGQFVEDLTYLYTILYLLTLWCRVLPEKLTALQLVKKFPAFHGIHYHTHKCLPPVSILGQPNPVHIPTSHLLEIHPNIIHPFTPRSPQWSPSLRFPQQDPTNIN